MEHPRLGHSGLRVSRLIYGNWLTHASQVEAERAEACVRAALDAGITTFDTADTYANTEAEKVLGKALAGERREGLVIATKVFWPTRPDGAPQDQAGPNDHGLSRKHVTESLHASLRRLGTDYVDLYQCHRFDHDTPLEETMEALADLVHAGKVHYVGASEWTADQLRRGHALARELRIPFVSNQPQYNLLWRVIEPEVVPTCAALGIGQVVWSPLAQGVLTGKYAPGQPLPEGSRATDAAGGAAMMKHLLKDELLATVARLAELADQAGVPLHHLALKWVVEQPTITAAIIGASRPEQVADNVRALAVELDPALVAQVDEVLGDSVKRDPSLTRSPHRIAEFG
ncbi:aldo/keto reductase [Kytococcus schroeteri]|uniref:Aldo/keto reductase n=1 Tax=Kytococcus schroeteri TaxID=138300 RepID=A0A2I1PB63_9MICO|nr:aldo/keto reductase family protein [Kytococcus schroeteri]PKZ41876.1 aldo/keto reductase [Kytococcus schroeteri]